MTEEREDARDEFDRRVAARRGKDRRSGRFEEHAAYWNRVRVAIFAVLGLVILPLAAFGFIAVLFVIYAVFYAPPIP